MGLRSAAALRVAVGIACWGAAYRLRGLGGRSSALRLRLMQIAFGVHVAGWWLAPRLRERLARPELLAGSVASCLLAELAAGANSQWPQTSLVAILVASTPGLVWSAFAECEDPIGEADPCALAALVLALLLGGRANLRAAAVVLLMLTGGQALEEFAMRRAGAGLRRMIGAMRMEGGARLQLAEGRLEEVPIAQLRVGDVVELAEGERVPADGVVLSRPSSGRSDFLCDESAITGESGAVAKRAGELVYSGSLICQGACLMRLRRSAAESVSSLIRLELEDALAARRQAPLERAAGGAARALTPLALLVAIAGFWIHRRAGWRRQWEVVLSVCMAATPCPLSIGVPVAFLSARGALSRHGVSLKNPGALEQLAEVSCVLVDKTGTLTTGLMELVGCDLQPTSGTVLAEQPGRPPVGGLTPLQRAVLHAAAALERESGSVHAVSQALQRASASASGQAIVAVRSVELEPGRGIRGRVTPADGRFARMLRDAELVVGSRLYVQSVCAKQLPDCDELPDSAEPDREGGFHVCVALLSRDKLAAYGHFFLSDQLRSDAVSFIYKLRSRLRVLLVSGDPSPALAQVAAAVGLNRPGVDWHLCLPDAKARLVKQLKAKGEKVLMIGDGMNDAAALALADVGIAVGSNDLVGSVSDVLVGGNAEVLGKVLALLPFARRTLHIAKRGVLCGMLMSSVQMIGAAGGLMPPLLNAVLQEIVDLSTVVHAMFSPNSLEVSL